MKRRWLAGVLSLGVLGALVVGQPVQATARSPHAKSPHVRATSDQQLLNTVLQEETAQWGSPALAGAIIHAKSITTAVTGVRRSGTATPVALDDRFHLASLTKAITSAAIARLVEKRQLSWSSTPGEVFPELASSFDPQLRNVTLAQLLSHHAGLAAYTSQAEYATLPPFVGTASEQRMQFALYLLRRPPAGPAGGFIYSNADYTIAAEMAERASGKTWEELVESNVLGPLGIQEHLGWPATNNLTGEPWGHWDTGLGVLPADPYSYQFPVVTQPAGDLNMSIGDFAKWVQANLRGLQGRDTPILRASTIKYLHTAQPGDVDQYYGPYGLGWQIYTYNGTLTSSHDGTSGTFMAIVAVQPSRDLAVVVFSNAGGAVGGNAVGESIQRLLG